MIIEPTGGFGNYMRTVFSYYKKCKVNNEKLIVIWKVTDENNGFFLDYFEPIENIEFLKDNSKKLKVNYRGCFTPHGFEPDYSPLKLKPFMVEKINTLKSKINSKFISVHIRRTDHSQLAKRKNAFTDDTLFINFIKENPNIPIYLATDNKETQDYFKNMFKNEINFYEEIQDKKERRKTSLEHAIIDVYLAGQSIKFRHSGYSSFSNLIMKFREQKIRE